MFHRLSVVISALVVAFGLHAASDDLPYDEDHPAAGRWLGEITPPGMSNGMFACLDITVDEDGEWTVAVTYPAAMALNAEAGHVEIIERSVVFEFTAMARTVRFNGEIDRDGQSLAGTVIPEDVEGDDEDAGSFEFERSVKPSDVAGARAFEGELVIPGIARIGMTFVFAEAAPGEWVGHLDVPMQMLSAYPLTDVARSSEGVITANVPVPNGASLRASIDEANNLLVGTFSQSGMEMEIRFEESFDYAGMKTLERPQHPTPPYPYRVRELTADTPEGFSLGGTLTLPSEDRHGPGPYPCAILISGSGQQDRDESLLGHKPFLVIADYLTRHGIAVMRYDDRGVGDSQVPDMSMVTGATSATFATDALAVLHRLREVDGIDRTKIGVIGHSEGGMIGPLLYELDQGLAFMVLLAGPGAPCLDLLSLQTQLSWRLAGFPEDAITAHTPMYEDVLRSVVDGADRATIAEGLTKIGEDQIARGLTPLTEEQMREIVDIQAGTLDNDWMRYFLAYDPEPKLVNVRCPVLAVNGTLDMQVEHRQNLDPIERFMTAAGRDITIKRYEELNHLFQPATTGAFSEYATITTTFDERVLADIVEWIGSVVGDQ